MATITKKAIIDDIGILLTKFGKTDESRLDEDYISYKVDQIRADMIIDKFNKEGIVDPTWLQDLGMVSFNKVNFADDPTVTACDCVLSKAFIPQIISLTAGNGNQDLGLYVVMSACGKTRYYPLEMVKWMYIPEGHERGKFHYYSRVNNALYVNKAIDKLRILAVLQNPEDGFTKSSEPVLSGSIANGIVYAVKYGQVIYNGAAYLSNSKFTGVTGVTTFTGNGQVFLDSQVMAFTDLDPYPASGEMVRAIVLDILTKEFNIERQAVVDALNDSKDDAQKV